MQQPPTGDKKRKKRNERLFFIVKNVLSVFGRDKADSNKTRTCKNYDSHQLLSIQVPWDHPPKKPTTSSNLPFHYRTETERERTTALRARGASDWSNPIATLATVTSQWGCVSGEFARDRPSPRSTVPPYHSRFPSDI